MRQTIEMAGVLTCKVARCTFNEALCCKAPNITVGDADPACDTFTTEPAEMRGEHPAVAECHVADCSFNSDAACGAAGVTVGDHATHADCLTYRAG